MRAGVECDLFVFSQTLIDERIHLIKIAKGRHGAGLALRKSSAKFFLRRQHDLRRARRLFQKIEINLQRSRQYRHGQLVVQLNHDGFGQLAARDMGGLGHLLRGESLRMADVDVFDIVTVEKFS